MIWMGFIYRNKTIENVLNNKKKLLKLYDDYVVYKSSVIGILYWKIVIIFVTNKVTNQVTNKVTYIVIITDTYLVTDIVTNIVTCIVTYMVTQIDIIIVTNIVTIIIQKQLLYL